MYHHAGRTDTVLFLARVAATWAKPTRVVVSGSSAGGYGATLNYDLLRRVYPSARMYLVDDAGPLLEGDSVPATERTAWFTSWNLDPIVTPLCPNCQTDLSAFYAALTARYGKDRMALLSSLQDVTIRSYFMLTADQFQTALLGLVQDHLAPTADFRAFLISGEQHTMLGMQDTATTGGVALESWLDDMVNDHAGWTTVQP
jgi:acetyl esterase/lipase